MRRRSVPSSENFDLGGSSIDSIQRGLDVLRCFLPGEEGLTATVIASRLKLPRATTLKLLDTLILYDFLRQDLDSDTFRLHVGCFVVGQAVLEGSQLVHRASSILQSLATSHKMQSLFCVHDRGEMLILCYEHGGTAPNLSLSVGVRLPVARSSLGFAWLYTQPPAVQSDWIARLRATPSSSSNAQEIAICKAFQDIDRSGVCRSFGEPISGIGFLSAPIRTSEHGDGFAVAYVRNSPSIDGFNEFEAECTAELLQAAALIQDCALSYR